MPTIDLQSAAVFFLALMNYGHKRFENNRIAKQDINKALDSHSNSVNELTNKMNQMQSDLTTALGSSSEIDTKLKAIDDKVAQAVTAVNLNNTKRNF